MKQGTPRTGFTLIELMLVVAIIGLLAAIALPKFADLVVKANEAAIRGKLGSLRSALSIYYADNEGTYPNPLPPPSLGVLTIGAKYIAEFPRIRIPTKTNHDVLSNAGFQSYQPDPVLYDWDFFDGWIYWVPIAGVHATTRQILVACTHTDSKGTIWSTY